MTELAKSAQGEKKQGMKEPANAVENGDIADLPFEKALAELETIVGRLERGEALKLRCEALLKLAEARIERITLSAQGKPVGTTPLDEN